MAPTSKDPGQFDAVAQPIHPTNQKSNVHKRNYVNQNALNSAQGKERSHAWFLMAAMPSAWPKRFDYFLWIIYNDNLR